MIKAVHPIKSLKSVFDLLADNDGSINLVIFELYLEYVYERLSDNAKAELKKGLLSVSQKYEYNYYEVFLMISRSYSMSLSWNLKIRNLSKLWRLQDIVNL